MKVEITLEDKGVNTVSYKMETVIPETDTKLGMVTPASIIALAVKAMFNNGMLAEAGSYALAEAAKGVPPEESIREKYDNSNT